jgi:hypothetical protein
VLKLTGNLASETAANGRSNGKDARPVSADTLTEELFRGGNYAAVARVGSPDQWQTFAALGLIGKARQALEGLGRFDLPEARFYSAVTSWIDGDTGRAIALLENHPLPHAQRLLALIRKPHIEILAQLPWFRWGCSDLVAFAEKDRTFRVRNISFHADDLPNQPYADVHRYYDPASPPDFFVCAMVEWHLVPPNLQQLPCPIIGQTGDYDLHLQCVRPWLDLFDELVVTDPSEWSDVQPMVSASVSTFPKSFGVPERLPDLPDAARAIDVFLSGTVLHPYHPDKAKLLHQILRTPDLRLKIINGFKDLATHYSNLANARVCVSYIRHATALPTRGLEALAMGCALVAQKDSVLGLYVGEQDGLLSYELEANNLGATIQHILANWPEFQRRARRGAQIVREEFSLTRVASQYLRFLTFLAARPRLPRREQPADRLVQKRCVLEKGWLPSYDFNTSPVLKRIGLRNHVRLRSQFDDKPQSSRPFIDAARESVLFNHHRALHRQIPINEWLESVGDLYKHGLERFPNSLVLRFNYIRVMLHYGAPEAVSQALDLLAETVETPPGQWVIDVMEDVFPWDFHPQYFNYRKYFDLITEQCTRGTPVEEALVQLILSSLYYYKGFYAPYNGYHSGGLEDFRQATQRDPEFPYYKLHYAERLLERNLAGDHLKAVHLLIELAGNSILFQEAFSLLEQFEQTHGSSYLAQLEPAVHTHPFWKANGTPERQQRSVSEEYRQLAAVIRATRASFEIAEDIAARALQPKMRPPQAEPERLPCLYSGVHEERDQLAGARGEIERLRALIAAMQSSKFWKLRNWWFKLKRKPQ